MAPCQISQHKELKIQLNNDVHTDILPADRKWLCHYVEMALIWGGIRMKVHGACFGYLFTVRKARGSNSARRIPSTGNHNNIQTYIPRINNSK